jgi:hypothetical protein
MLGREFGDGRRHLVNICRWLKANVKISVKSDTGTTSTTMLTLLAVVMIGSFLGFAGAACLRFGRDVQINGDSRPWNFLFRRQSRVSNSDMEAKT